MSKTEEKKQWKRENKTKDILVKPVTGVDLSKFDVVIRFHMTFSCLQSLQKVLIHHQGYKLIVI